MHARSPHQEATAPPGAQFVASAADGVYFPVADRRWARLAATDRRWFSDEEAARAAGYDPARLSIEGLEEFEIVAEIGRGATATVYRARDRILERDVAIKVVHRSHQDDDETLARCFREARVVARLDHPGIVSLYSVRRLASGGLALVMEYVPGRTLRELIRDEGPLPIDRVERILREVGAALAAAHHQGIVHRDVKPQNIFLQDTGGRCLLADFGIAIPLGEVTRITHAGAVIGTPAYMSPEQFDGDAVDGRSDLYSLGLVAWEMLTGHSPWEGESLFNIVYKQKTVPVPPLGSVRRGVSPRLRIAIERALRKDPRDRWGSVEEFLACLDGKVPGIRWRIAALLAFSPLSREQPARPEGATATVEADAPTVRLPRAGAAGLHPRASQGPIPRTGTRRWAMAGGLLLALALLGAAAAGLRQQSPSGQGPARQETATRADPVVIPPITAAARPAMELIGGVPQPSAEEPLVGDSATALPAAETASSDPADSIRTASAPPVEETAAEESAAPAQPPVEKEVPPAPPVPVLPVDDRPSRLAAGGLHSCAILGGGVVSCWGGNERGQVGRGSGAREVLPFTVDLAAAPYAIVTGGFHSCLLDRTGAVYCWGDNRQGQLGGGASLDSGPRRVGEQLFFSLAAGLSHTCGIARNREAFCWGANERGQLGVGSTDPRPGPSRVRGPEPLVSITAGWTHSCALSASGRAYCWGDNSRGQLGDGTTTGRAAPTPVSGSLRFRSISAGSGHTCAVSLDGEAYCWGQNGDGRLGDGTTGDRTSPARVESNLRFAEVSAGGRHTCGLTGGGAAYCWGQNGYGQLGDGTSTFRTTPVPAAANLRFQTIRSGGSHTCGLSADGSQYCWGFNIEGQLGDGTLTHRGTPAPVSQGRNSSG